MQEMYAQLQDVMTTQKTKMKAMWTAEAALAINASLARLVT